MKIIFHKDFVKNYKKLKKSQKENVDKALNLFKENPFNPILKNHGLNGSLKYFRSISAENDLRILFREKDNYILVVIISVGSHNQVYKN